MFIAQKHFYVRSNAGVAPDSQAGGRAAADDDPIPAVGCTADFYVCLNEIQKKVAKRVAAVKALFGSITRQARILMLMFFDWTKEGC